MKNHVRIIEKRRSAWKRTLATVIGMAVFVGGMVFDGETAGAKEAAFVDISTDMISLSPQATEVRMNVAARNMPEGTELIFRVADEGICSVRWVEKDVKKYTQLCCQRGEMTGDTVITVFAAEYPESARQIRVVNKEVADSYEYEGNGSTMICGLYMPPVPYEVHAVSEDADGYFALTYSNAEGDRKVLFNRAGAYNGSVSIGRGTEGTTFEVLATGRWKITMTPVLETAMPVQSGTGSQVSGCFRGDNKTHSVYCANWADKGNFIVWLYDADDNSKKLLANGAGTYGRNKGNVYLNASHSYYISVESEGNWLVEFSK